MHIAQLEDSEIRFTFDVNFQIKDILEPEEFVKMSIDGLPSSNEE